MAVMITYLIGNIDKASIEGCAGNNKIGVGRSVGNIKRGAGGNSIKRGTGKTASKKVCREGRCFESEAGH